MTYVILDLEFNGAYSRKANRFVNEIIEFGAVKCDENLNIVDTFSSLVTPKLTKKLNPHVSRLTHLDMDELRRNDNGFESVFARFRKFMGDGVLMTWGTGDILVLMENCRLYFGGEEIPGLQAYVNLQRYCENALDYHDRSRQMGLSACAERIGIGFDGDTLHRALTDAELTSLCFQKLYRPELFESCVMTVGDDLYRRITFKNYNLCDIHNPGIDRREFSFVCDRCGRKARRRSRWIVKNKSFRARFRCRHCKRDFEGRLSFKQCYDHVQVFRRAVDLPTEQEKA